MTSPSSYPLLARVNDPADVRRLARTQLPQLAQELRAFVLEASRKPAGTSAPTWVR